MERLRTRIGRTGIRQQEPSSLPVSRSTLWEEHAGLQESAEARPGEKNSDWPNVVTGPSSVRPTKMQRVRGTNSSEGKLRCFNEEGWASQVALVVKNPPANAGYVRDVGSIPGLGRSPGNGNPLQYSCLENPMDRGAWRVTVRGVAKNQTQLKRLSTQAHTQGRRWKASCLSSGCHSKTP